ncbi:MAG: flagellar biosynthetic protein FliR [Burkholderiales bacterium]|jgi:flagellar biosynthetic protein FliR|nr:flagellar biosynthetic protein FliR [Burkholderiales bacterium]
MISFTDAQLQAWMAAFLLPFFRILALFTAAPVLSIRSVPTRLRVGIALLLAVTLAPGNVPTAGIDLVSFKGLGYVAQEVMVGLAIGFAARLAFAAFDLAGELIGMQMGLSYAGFFDPQGGQGNAVGAFMNTTATLTFVALNGPLLLVAATMRSFDSLPIGRVPFEFVTRFDPIALGAEVFALGLLIATPFLALILFVNLMLGVMTRVAPQLGLFSIGFPITIGTGMVLLLIGLPWIERPMVQGLMRLVGMFG